MLPVANIRNVDKFRLRCTYLTHHQLNSYRTLRRYHICHSCRFTTIRFAARRSQWFMKPLRISFFYPYTDRASLYIQSKLFFSPIPKEFVQVTRLGLRQFDRRFALAINQIYFPFRNVHAIVKRLLAEIMQLKCNTKLRAHMIEKSGHVYSPKRRKQTLILS